MSGGLTDAEREAVEVAAIAVNGHFPDDLIARVARIKADAIAAARAEERARLNTAVREWWVSWFPPDAELHVMYDDFEDALKAADQ